jgi:hypothetical protein
MGVNYLLSCIIILLISLNTFGQQIVKGKILNSKTQEPIQYANIGFKKSNVGTISNPDGSFSLYIPENIFDDTLIVSSIGFGSKNIPLKQLLTKNELAIFLNEKIVTLNTGVGRFKKGKDKNI